MNTPYCECSDGGFQCPRCWRFTVAKPKKSEPKSRWTHERINRYHGRIEGESSTLSVERRNEESVTIRISSNSAYGHNGYVYVPPDLIPALRVFLRECAE
jgi:hypothetical protein